MKKMHAVSLLLVGIVLGCGAAAVAPTATSWADAGSAAAGGWACYVADRFEDLADARGWDGSVKIENGLNQVANHVPAGTIVPITPEGGQSAYPSVVCVKH